jgi:hypothetical protein
MKKSSLVRGFFGVLEKMMQGSVLPRDNVSAGQFLQATQIRLGDLIAGILIIRIAEVDATAQRARFARRAEIAILKGTEIRRDGLRM